MPNWMERDILEGRLPSQAGKSFKGSEKEILKLVLKEKGVAMILGT